MPRGAMAAGLAPTGGLITCGIAGSVNGGKTARCAPRPPWLRHVENQASAVYYGALLRGRRPT